MKDWYFLNGFRWVSDESLDFKDKVIEARSIFNDILLFYKEGDKPEHWWEAQGANVYVTVFITFKRLSVITISRRIS